MNTNEFLEYVDKRIKKIEEKDPDYLHNAKWLELRAKQDDAFKELAKNKLAYFEFLANKYSKDQERCKIYTKRASEYREYLQKQGEPKNENTL